MSLSFLNYKNISTNKDMVKDILKLAHTHPEVFVNITSFLANYKGDISVFPDIDEAIELEFNSPKYDLDDEKRENLIQTIKDLYGNSSKIFNKIRSKILEEFICNFGPVSTRHDSIITYIEPTIMDGKQIVGITNKKCDVVFIDKNHTFIEFVECKTDICNVIPRNRPFEKAGKSHQDKVKYLENAYNYLKDNYCEPKIYFACYNSDYEESLNNLQQNWGYEYMDFVNPKKLLENKFS
ncbi:hypothetical protein SJY89_10030 [Bacillus velezensis]|uniref:hypothetical protein n=1 Tax=Bacillus amyloliquefaciens group TaxID=1938374 RepID=UPI0007AA750C|nr:MULTISPECIES: hypothetical protein [Bacillus amyloliquefaciens group]KZE59745.1 hypothetical protein AV542_01500 [Bacillus amyloliquefaciens]MBO3791803.1 hypothetical protein [Bacillus velezensis]MCQ9150264.1 hypothetical protein [Bacillus amyloliquefaciens]MDX7895560.1 hypothetical protein [Bacillus velezensis]MDX8025607.1 hypothetical protein [Bacillus velezensis]